MKNKSLSDLNIKDLINKRNQLRKEIFEAKIKNATRSLKQTHTIKSMKKELARVSTLLSSNANKWIQK